MEREIGRRERPLPPRQAKRTGHVLLTWIAGTNRRGKIKNHCAFAFSAVPTNRATKIIRRIISSRGNVARYSKTLFGWDENIEQRANVNERDDNTN